MGSSDKIGRLTPSGNLTEFPVASNLGVDSLIPAGTGLAVGSDGNIWFILANSTEVGRITTAGTVSSFSLGSSTSPTAIAAGPDGNIWVAAYDSQAPFNQRIQMARITPAGTMTTFVVPPASLNFEGPVITALAAGPDGDLWFGDSVPGFIDRMSTSGSVTHIPLSTTSPFGTYSEVSAITAGTNGDLWFLANIPASGGTEAVGHVTPDGTISAFPTLLDTGTMTMGPDGNLWITQRTGFVPASVERVTPSGTFSKFTTQLHVNYRKDTPLTTLGITTGSDGNLWITEAPGQHGYGPGVRPGVSGPYEVLQLVVSRSTPDGAKGGHRTKHQKPKPKPHLKPKPPHGHGWNRA